MLWLLKMLVVTVLTIASAAWEGLVAWWILGGLFPQFGYWDWCRIAFVLTGIVVASIHLANLNDELDA